MAGRERGLHRHDLVAHEIVEPLEHARVERAAAQRGGAFEQHRARIGAGEGDAQLGERVAVAAQRHRDARHGIFDRAADADLVVGRAQAGRVARAHGGDELARPQRQIVFAVAQRLGDRSSWRAVADIEPLERHRARPRRPGEIDLGAERHQRRREIAAEGGEAHAAALRRHVADIARGLEAMVVGGAPPFALIVEDAARVEAEIAADRAHVAMRRPGDGAGRLRHHRIMPHHLRMRGKLGQRDRGADLERVRVGLDGAQLRDVVDVDQRRRRDDAAPDVDQRSVPPPSSRLPG